MPQVKARVMQYEKEDGTHYLAQRYVWKSHWFSESKYEWEYFYYCNNGSLQVLYPNSNHGGVFKNKGVAVYYCKKYLRVTYGDKVVTEFSVEGED